jgi:hypothetical protein
VEPDGVDITIEYAPELLTFSVGELLLLTSGIKRIVSPTAGLEKVGLVAQT